MEQNRENRERELLDRAAVFLRDSVADRTQGAVETHRAARNQRWPAIDRLARSLDWGQPQIGDMPPQPPTWRGRLGAIAVRMVRRALFWYSQQLAAFQQLVSNAAREQVQILEQSSSEHERTRSAIAAVDARAERLERQLEQSVSNAAREQIQILEQSSSEQERTRSAIAAVDARVERVERQLAEVRESISEGGDMQARLGQTEAELKRLGRLAEESRRLMQQQSLRVTVLLKELRAHDRSPSATPVAAEERDPWPDLVSEHADAFRGSPTEIRERQRVYLPHIRSAVEATSGSPVLDVGCGRGEWLELLRESQILARGVDASPSMVRACLDKGLDVTRAELIAHLRETSENSLSAVTAFQVVEHLEWSELVELIDQAVRVLRPGGLVILETPNPRNIQVASYNFYLDPTHVRPLPSELLSFLVEARGLCEPETVLLHPYPECCSLESGASANDFLNQVFFGAQDYAVIAKRP